MKIRRTQETDVTNMVALLNELGYQTPVSVLTVQLGIYSDSNSRALVAECQNSNDVLGMITGHVIPLIHQSAYLGRITSMVVSESSRRSGVGRRLIQELETWFCGKQCVYDKK